MVAWGEFEKAAPDLAAYGAVRFGSGVAYLATVRRDGGPRVYPITPIIGSGRLFVAMEPTSPKGYDLRRDGRFALHSSVGGSSGQGGEFSVRGYGAPVDDPTVKKIAVASSSYAIADRYVLFELFVQSALSPLYDNDELIRQVWREE